MKLLIIDCGLLQCSVGPYSTIEDKERMTLIKSLENLQHTYLLPVQYSACSAAGAMVIRPYMEHGSLRDQMCKVIDWTVISVYVNDLLESTTNDTQINYV